MSLSSTLASRLGILLGGRIALLFLAFLSTALLTRILGPDGFGLYRTSVAYLALVVVLADLGLGSIFVRSISRPGADQVNLVANALALRLVIASAAFGIAVGLALWLPFNRETQIAIIGGALGFLAYSVHLLLFGLFQQRMKQQGVVLAEMVGGVVLVGFILGLAHLGAEPFWFVVALGASYMFTLAITLSAARRLVPLALRFRLGIWRELVQSAMPLAATATLSIIYVRADILFLALLQPAAVVGLYGVPIKIMDALMGIALLYAGLFAPLFSKTAPTKREAFASHVETSLSTLAIGSVGIAVVIFVLAEQLVTLLGGSAFRDAAGILQVLGFVFVLHSATILIREAATALAVQKKLLPGYILGFLVAMAAYLSLIPTLGGIGAALALLVAETVVLTAALRVVRREALARIRLGAPIVTLVCGLSAIVTIAWLDVLSVGWGLRLLAGVAVYTGLLLGTKTLRPADVLGLLKGFVGGKEAQRNID